LQLISIVVLRPAEASAAIKSDISRKNGDEMPDRKLSTFFHGRLLWLIGAN